MEEFIKEIKDISNKFDKLMKDEIGYTMEEMLKLKGEDFEKTADEFVEKVLKKMTEKKEETDKEKFEKYKKQVKEKEHGQFLKIYEATTPNGEGVVVEGQGKVQDILFFGTKGLGQIIKQNKHIFKDVDELVDTLCEQIKDEIKGGE